MQYDFKAHAVEYCEYCGRTAGRIETPLGKNFTRLQLFSLEILFAPGGPGPGPWGSSLMDDPAMQIQSVATAPTVTVSVARLALSVDIDAEFL